MRLPSLEDLCIFDIKFLLSSRLLSCWLFLTCRPRSPNFPIFNAGLAASTPPPPTSAAPPQLNAVWLLLLACAVCTVLELQCAALSPSCTLNPEEQYSLVNYALLFINSVPAPCFRRRLRNFKCLSEHHVSVSVMNYQLVLSVLQAVAFHINTSRSSLEFCASVTVCKLHSCSVDAQWRMPIPYPYMTSMSPIQASLCCPAC